MTTAAPRTREILTAAQVNGRHVTLTGQLDRAEYVAVDGVLTALGGKWNRTAGAHVFPGCPADALAAVIAGGSVPLPARTAEGFVATPDDTASAVVMRHLPKLAPGARVLEPSAGAGAFVRAITARYPAARVVAVEPNATRAQSIPTGDGVSVVVSTLEEYAAGAPGPFDAVVMNPPFSVPGNRTIWVDHVLAAWSLMAPGGHLVAIVPAGFAHRTDRKHRQARELIDAHGGTEDLPADTFKASGVTVQACVVWATKPEPVAGAAGDRRPWVFREYGREVEPVRVPELRLDADAARRMPVQVWRDSWRNADRVARFCALCAACRRPVWAFDDGDNDCRGVLGDASAGFSLDAEDYDQAGPSVGLCAVCANERGRYDRGLKLARQVWSDVPQEPETPEETDGAAAIAPDLVEVLRPVQLDIFADLLAARR